MLRRLGVAPPKKGLFRLADGTRIERDIGQTWVRLEGSGAIVPVIFGDEDARPLIGAVTLEIFLLGVDPVGGCLMPVAGFLMLQSG
jgi:predicted aspartyl protease